MYIGMPYNVTTPYGTGTGVYSPRFLEYEDLNYDSDVREKLIKYFIKRATEKWLERDFNKLLGYLVVKKKDGRLVVDLISSLKDYSEDQYKNDKPEDLQAKKEFIAKYFLTRKLVNHVLKEYVMMKGVNWYDLKMYRKGVRDALKHKLKKRLKKAVDEKK
jgi:hypothetical protein